jgi:hypothetical protein
VSSIPSSWNQRALDIEVYPGIDVVVYGDQRRLEYDFVVASGADPARIRLRVVGGATLGLDARDDLHIRHGDRQIVQ